MLSKENNELLTNIEGQAPMGQLMRQYWVPACRGEALIEDGDPVRVRLFGENYVAFRATDGRVGIFNEACPHRSCSLLLARNEDNALTCIFHGWKFDVSGKTVLVPSEPRERHDQFCEKVPLKHYPVKESGSIVWVYLGEGEPPGFPMFIFNSLPESHVFTRVAYTNVNWLQGLEATIDSSHVGVLHQHWVKNDPIEDRVKDFTMTAENTSLVYEVDKKPYGLTAGALRDRPNGDKYVRITEYVMPYFSFTPFSPGTRGQVICAVPVDNEHTAQWYISYNPFEPFTEEQIAAFDKNHAGDGDPNDFYTPKGTFDNRWLQDRRLLEEGHWTGVHSLNAEDFIVEESMGAIVDRSQEFLSPADTMIIQTRLLLLRAVNSFKEDGVLFARDVKIDYESIRGVAGVIPSDEDWRNVSRDIISK